MKIRNGYVSNSSSASFIIAYDKNFFGDLISLLKNSYLGCETYFKDVNVLLEQLSEKDKQYCQNIIDQKIKEGKTVEYITLDREFNVIFDLLKQISEQNGNDKIEFIFKD